MVLRIRLLIVFLVFAIVTGCVNQPISRSVGNSQNEAVDHSLSVTQHKDITAYEFQLFFGLSKPDGGVVEPAQWSAFETDTISPEFYEGFTVFDATGFYQGNAEQSKVLSLIVSADAVDVSLKKIKHIARTYVAKFAQESVMLTKTPVLEWEFIEAN